MQSPLSTLDYDVDLIHQQGTRSLCEVEQHLNEERMFLPVELRDPSPEAEGLASVDIELRNRN